MTLAQDLTCAPEQISADDVLASHFTLVAQPGAIEPIEVDGVDGWTSPNTHPVLSLMRWTTQDEAVAAAGLDAVLDRFRSAGRGFDWMTGPACHEAGLLPLLEERGFIQPPLQVAAMVKHITPHDAPTLSEDIRLWQVEDVTDSRIWGVMANGFDIPDHVAAVFHHAYAQASPLQRTDIYAAALDGHDTPVGVGYLSYIGDGPAVLFRVSCTLSESRGRGIYSAMVQRRLYDAHQNGRTQAFVHAYTAESRRSLELHGFTCAGELQLHRWRP